MSAEPTKPMICCRVHRRSKQVAQNNVEEVAMLLPILVLVLQERSGVYRARCMAAYTGFIPA